MVETQFDGNYFFIPLKLDGIKDYSHLSNKRGVTLIDFEKKIHPPRTFPPSMFIDFLDFFHPPTVWDRVPKEDAANFESDTFL